MQRALDKGQRQSVVALVRAGEEKRLARIHSHERRERDGGHGDGGSINWNRMRLESYVQDIGLDADQQKKVQGFLPKEDLPDLREGPKTQLQALLDAFAQDGFEVTAFPVDDLKIRLTPLLEVVKFLSQVVPTLKPEQREKLAAKFEKGPTMDRPGRRHRPNAPHAPPHGEDDDEERMRAAWLSVALAIAACSRPSAGTADAGANHLHRLGLAVRIGKGRSGAQRSGVADLISPVEARRSRVTRFDDGLSLDATSLALLEKHFAPHAAIDVQAAELNVGRRRALLFMDVEKSTSSARPIIVVVDEAGVLAWTKIHPVAGE